MLPVVIDLLSSPDLPHPRPRVANKKSPASYGAEEKRGRKKDDWFVLSLESDGVDVDVGSSFVVASPRKTTSTTGKSASTRIVNSDPKPSSSTTTVFAQPAWSFGNLDKANVKQPAKTGDKERVEGRVVKSAKPVQSKAKMSDFYFLEDDFDSTVNFDESVLLPAKKRRVSESQEENAKPVSAVSVSANGPRPRESPKTKPMPAEFTSVNVAGLREGGYKRSISNIESSTTSKAKGQKGRTTSTPMLKRASPSTRTLTASEEDPIFFTSSPDPILDAARRRREKAKKNAEVDVFGFMPLAEDDIEIGKTNMKAKGEGKASIPNLYKLSSDEDDIQDWSTYAKKGNENVPPKNASKPEKKNNYDPFGFEDSSDMELPDYSASKVKKGAKSPSSKNGEKSTGFFIDSSSDLELSAVGAIKGKPKSKPKKADDILAKYEATRAKERTAKAKADAKAEAKAAKEAEKEEKRLAKEQKARDKQREKELQTVNKLKTDRKETAQEMIVDLPSSLEKKLQDLIHAFLDIDKIEYREYNSLQPIVKWRRKAVSEFDEGKEHWVPLAKPTITSENHILYVITAKEFVNLVLGDEGHDVNSLTLRLKAKFDSHKLIFLMEGMIPWIRKNRSVKDRQFKEAVQSHAPPEQLPTASQRSKKKKQDEYVEEEKVEDALLKLQIEHGVLIHHTQAMQETAAWIKIFTENISTVPYKKQNLTTNFCMETGQVKTGENALDTYVKMLQEMVRITAPIAYGIAAEYPTVQNLVRGLEEHGPLALEDCRKSANRDGALADRRVGQAVSKRIYNVFMGEDPGSFDV